MDNLLPLERCVQIVDLERDMGKGFDGRLMAGCRGLSSE